MGESRGSNADHRAPVGYLVNGRDGLWGRQGVGYDYIVAGNGLFVQAEAILLRARVLVAPAQVRGLAPVDEKVELVNGLIPGELFEKALRLMKLSHPMELFCAFVWQGDEYHLKLPNQRISHGSVHYERADSVVLDFHSHGTMSAFFSSTDNADEQGFRCYAVAGKLLEQPEVNMRVGLYGHFAPVSWPELFSGPAPQIRFKGEFYDLEQESDVPAG